MKRVAIVLLVLLVAVGGMFAQATSFDFSTFQTALGNFAQGAANSLPFNALVGLNWSDAYIGQLIALPPHLGFGVTAGATLMPIDSVSAMLTTLKIDLSNGPLAPLQQWGIPIPAYTIDARIGGIVLPFDIGVKFGYIPEGFVQKTFNLPVDVNYLMAGADFRFALVKENIILPNISVGAGYTIMRGSVLVPGLLGNNVTVSNFKVGTDTYTLGFTDPSLSVGWTTNVLDLKAQISKSLLIITPYLGVGASLGLSSVDGGVQTNLTINGAAATQAQIDSLNALLTAAGQPQLSTQGFTVGASAPAGWAFRVFGGASLNILILKIDVGAMYNFISGSLGATVGVRLQI